MKLNLTRMGSCYMERVYVEVKVEIDSTGYMQPLSITWADGRNFVIEKVLHFHPERTAPLDHPIDYYIVLIRGREKFLFFEHADPRLKGRLGRWYVEEKVFGAFMGRNMK